MSRCVTPRGASASTTALTTAGGIPMVPARPGAPRPPEPRGHARARLALDPDRRDDRARAPDLGAGAEEARRLEAGLLTGRQVLAPVGELGDARPGDDAAP